MHHAFLYISLRLLHDYNVKLPSLKIGDCEQSGKEAEIGKINHEAKKQGRTETLQIFFQIIIPKLVLDEGNSNSVKTYLLVGLWAEFWSSGLSRLWRKNQAVSETGFNCQLTKIKINSLYSGHCWDLELVSSLAGVRNCGSLFQSNISFFAGELAAVRIIGVSVIAGCPQGES